MKNLRKYQNKLIFDENIKIFNTFRKGKKYILIWSIDLNVSIHEFYKAKIPKKARF